MGFDCNLKFLLSSITNKIFKIQRDQERLYTVGWLNTKLGWVEDPEGGRRSPGPANVFFFADASAYMINFDAAKLK